MEREEELEQTIDELNYRLTNALKKIDRLKLSIKQAREEIKSISQEVPYRNQAFSYGISICKTDNVLEILDKLIESEEK